MFRYFRTRSAWTNVVQEIRKLPGLDSFLLPPPYHRLQPAAERGPVIIINVNERRSDAIIILASGDPVLAPLPHAYPELVLKLIDRLGDQPAKCNEDVAIYVLREIWRTIITPIATSLRDGPIALAQGSRIWLCPIGAAARLPLHAAGPYAKDKFNFAHLFISSYTPSLGALIQARTSRVVGPKVGNPVKSILVVGQPDTPGEPPLPKVVDEVQTIVNRWASATVLESSEGTREAVMSGIKTHAWLHLACHGHHNPEHPFQSHFSMYDGPITLLDVIKKDLPLAELAVLSACHSARASELLPDEALHPAAGIMFAGFKSVIGTMWALDDGLGSALAGQFYELMLKGKKDYTDAAVVLGDTFRALIKKDRDSVSFMQRINVVHFGA